MPASKATRLSSLFGSAIKTQIITKPKPKPKPKPKSKLKPNVIAKPPPPSATVDDTTLKNFFSALATSSEQKPSSAISFSSSSSSSSSSAAVDDNTLKHFVSALATSSEQKPSSAISSSVVEKISEESIAEFLLSRLSKSSEDSADSEISPSLGRRYWLTNRIASILIVDDDSESLSNQEEFDAAKFLESELAIPWFPAIAHGGMSLQRKEVTRERKQKWFFKSSQVTRFNRLVNMCADKVGTGAAFGIFGKLGRDTTVRECNALLKLCIEKAKSAKNEEVALEQIHRAYVFFKSMKEHGFRPEAETYGPFLDYLIDMAMVQEFHFFCDIIKEANPKAVPKLGYYEMLLWITVDDEEKIQELFNHIVTEEGENNSSLRENYLLALCEGGREKELVQIFDIIDITKFTSMDTVAVMFKSLGKLQLEAFVEKFLLSFKSHDFGAENFSNFLCSYAIGNPNLAVEDVVLTFKNLHAKHEVTPSSASYEDLIKYCCSVLKVHVALDLVNEMLEEGLTLSMEPINCILHACEESCNYNLVHRVHTLICDHNLKPNGETFRMMITFSMRMKDVAAAYNILSDVEKMNVTPTANMYNTIMAGYFREKNSRDALMVLKEMEKANVKPDSKTFSYLISNCESEEDIDKYCEELKLSGIQITKTVFMALIKAYARFGLFEKAKQVVSDKLVPATCLNEIKSVLIQALAKHGQLSDALSMYEEIKQSGCSIEPKAVIALIEHYNSDGGTSTLLQLLKELDDSHYCLDGCFRVVLYCVQYKQLSTAVDLLKQLRQKFCFEDEFVVEALLDEVFNLIGDSGPEHLQMGLDILKVVKDDLGLTPPRKCLDFLLQACVNAKDLDNARLVWKEYEAAGLPYNIFSFLRMYQAVLASGDHKASAIMLTKIPKEDRHVCRIIKACQRTYTGTVTLETKKKKNKTEKEWKSL